MRPSFHPRLINNPFDDPGLFIPFFFENRALIFDLGDNTALPARDILKITHAFVSHTHMDHFSGFDRLLRLFLGRDKDLYLYGPKGFLKNVEGKLAGYTWNLVDQYAVPFTLHATEVHEKEVLTQEYRCREAFEPIGPKKTRPFTGILLTEPALTVSALILDHKIACLGFCLEERFHVNIIKESLTEMDLSVGPWLREFKQALYRKTDPASEFVVKESTLGKGTRCFQLGDLADRITRITPGQKIVYLTDLAASPENLSKAIPFAKRADHLFIEAAFLAADRHIADEKRHLTASDAGRIAGLSGAKQVTLFHYSPRYTNMANVLEKEAAEAFQAASR